MDFECRVSSVLNRNVKEFGKKFLFDGRDDTCWNSEQGTPQWVQINYGCEKEVTELHIMFQGGFAGKSCWVEVKKSEGGEFERAADFFPEDTNKLQKFTFSDNPLPLGCVFKIVFSDSTDFFGRITIYQLKLVTA